MDGWSFELLPPGCVSQADFNRIVQLEEECGLPDPYPPALIEKILSSLTTFVCRIDGEIAGFIMVSGNGRYFGRSVYIVNLNVAAAFRRQGIATRLILMACRHYLDLAPNRLMSLDVTLGNPALRLYEKTGFRRTFLPSRNGQSDIVMAAPLKTVCRTIESIL